MLDTRLINSCPVCGQPTLLTPEEARDMHEDDETLHRQRS